MERFALEQGLKFRQAELKALWLRRESVKKLFDIAIIIAIAILLIGVAAFTLKGTASTKSKNVSTPAAVSANSQTIKTVKLPLEVNIANNGLVLVRGAQVTNVFGDTIELKTSWGLNEIVWLVKTNQLTKYINRTGQKQTFSDIGIGDTVTVTGKLSGTDKMTIDAEYVRE